MATMTVIYKTPPDIAAFEKHYYEIHIPLAKKIPGLKSYEVSDSKIISPTGHNETYLVANLYFDNMETMKAAFASPEGQACAADRKIMVPDNAHVQIYLFNTKEV